MGAYPNGVSYRGINRAGAEYGDDWDGWTGQTFYTIPTKAELDSELAFYGDKGFNTIRLPISWERLQHSLSGPLETSYMNQVLAFANQATAAGWLTIIDLHNYNRYATGAFDAAGVQVNTYLQQVFGDGLLVHRVISRRHTARQLPGQLADFQGGPSRTGSNDEHIQILCRD